MYVERTPDTVQKDHVDWGFRPSCIEVQLAPNNHTYTHSLSYTHDNYTNTDIQGSVALTRNLIFQLGISDGTETRPEPGAVQQLRCVAAPAPPARSAT